MTTNPIRAVRRAGDRAVLLELHDAATVHQAHQALTAERVDGLADVVAGAATLLLIAEHPHGTALRRATARVRQIPAEQASPAAGGDAKGTVTIPVRYDGQDLADVARLRGVSTEEVVRMHTARTYTAGFFGFAPGFAYLTGLDPALHLPRRGSPRTEVPAGTVAIASEYTGVYPRRSPGGWHLLGTTTTPLWDLDRPRPALLTPGTRVRFEPTGG